MDIRQKRTLGCSIIFTNPEGKVLLYKRDNNPSIPEPGKWDLIGGKVEDHETPDDAIIREVKEELGIHIKQVDGIELSGHHLFRVYEFHDRVEHTYWCKLNEDINNLILNEGETLAWVSEHELETFDIAFGFEQVIADFFKDAPFIE